MTHTYKCSMCAPLHCLTRSTLSSDTRDRPALFPLQRHPVVWNCWYQRLMLLGDGGSLLNCRRNTRWTETTDLCFTKCSTQNAFSSGVAIIILFRHRPREKRGVGLRIIPYGKLTSMCVLKVVMADWNRSNHFDTPCIYIIYIYYIIYNIIDRDLLSLISVTIVTSLQAERFQSRQVQELYLIPETSRLVLWPTQSPTQWIPWFYARIKAAIAWSWPLATV